MLKLPLERVRAVTFDLYGTLLDLEASFAPGFAGFLKSKGFLGNASDVVQAWETAYLHESNVDSLLGRPRTPFEVVRRLILSQLFHRLKIEHTEDDIEQLVTTKATPTLFPDVKESLTRLKGKYDLSVLSNGDLASLNRAVSGLGIPVVRAISAEQAGYYKPHAGVYQHAIKELGLPGEQVLHVAAHAWDIRGARAAGMAGAYINRYGIPYVDADGSQADLEMPGLSELADHLTGV
ncbi:MAG: haloacid dehalogenase type II [SAR202 cluster bacterium]|nr:haloacid dehalogenase type II [SAR202 cluster bacterium]